MNKDLSAATGEVFWGRITRPGRGHHDDDLALQPRGAGPSVQAGRRAGRQVGKSDGATR